MTEEISKQPGLKSGIYRHYKGNDYEVVGLACHSETLQWLVVYRPLYDHTDMPGLWVRPYEMFVENIKINGLTVPRFEYVGDKA